MLMMTHVLPMTLVYATVDSTSKHISDNTIKLLGNPNESVTIALYTIDPRVVYTEVYAELLSYPPGFVLDNDSSNSLLSVRAMLGG